MAEKKPADKKAKKSAGVERSTRKTNNTKSKVTAQGKSSNSRVRRKRDKKRGVKAYRGQGR